jgi:DNA-binding winged helix-turn-helix (wHTH) protein
VTREEVRRQLWPDTFLANLDANVNTTINKLRQVLGDSPENPVYVETIPRRGYSFIASVEFSSVPAAPPAELLKTVFGCNCPECTFASCGLQHSLVKEARTHLSPRGQLAVRGNDSWRAAGIRLVLCTGQESAFG